MRSFGKCNMYADWRLLSNVVFVRTYHMYTIFAQKHTSTSPHHASHSYSTPHTYTHLHARTHSYTLTLVRAFECNRNIPFIHCIRALKKIPLPFSSAFFAFSLIHSFTLCRALLMLLLIFLMVDSLLLLLLLLVVLLMLLLLLG